METRELKIFVDKSLVISEAEVVKVVNGVYNQDRGVIALKSLAQRENIVTTEVADWVRKKGWIVDSYEGPKVTVQAIIDWCQPIKFDKTIEWSEDDILMKISNNSIYVNSNATRYQEFVDAMLSAGLRQGYNRDIKTMRLGITKEQRRELISRGYKLKRSRRVKL